MDYLIMKNHADFNDDYMKIIFAETNISTSYYSNSKWVDFYLQTPSFKVIDIRAEKNKYSVLVKLTRSAAFNHIITAIDSHMINQLKKQYGWAAVDYFVPTLKLHNGNPDLLRLDIPIVHQKPLVAVYDENSEELPFPVLDVGFQGHAILRPKIISNRSDDRSIHCELVWDVPQIKVTIPEYYFDTCILSDDDDDGDSVISECEPQEYYVQIQN